MENQHTTERKKRKPKTGSLQRVIKLTSLLLLGGMCYKFPLGYAVNIVWFQYIVLIFSLLGLTVSKIAVLKVFPLP